MGETSADGRLDVFGVDAIEVTKVKVSFPSGKLRDVATALSTAAESKSCSMAVRGVLVKFRVVQPAIKSRQTVVVMIYFIFGLVENII